MRVLVVEDCDDSYLLFEAYVSGRGHEIERVLDGSQALERRKRQDFDVIFMDVNMPVMDGYTATRAIRDWESANTRTHIPIILLSADDRSRQKSLGAAAGCSGYLTKPIPQADLLAALHYYGKPLTLAES
jgi:CheY-like chemotaxis protein